MLPKDGRWSPAPMRVTIGAPVDPNRVSAAQLRDLVVALRAAVRAGYDLAA